MQNQEQPASEPHMPPDAAEALKRAILTADLYLEYGMGGSTMFARENGISVISTENDPRWVSQVEEHTRGLPGFHHFAYVDTGPTKQLGWPADGSGKERYGDYSARPWELAKGWSVHPDIVLIDGRWRVACLFMSLLQARPGTIIYFDDYVGRPYWKRVEPILRPAAMHGRMAQFHVPALMPWHRVKDAYQCAAHDPT